MLKPQKTHFSYWHYYQFQDLTVPQAVEQITSVARANNNEPNNDMQISYNI